MMKKVMFLAISTLAVLPLLPLSAQANDKISYDYWQFGYVHSEGELTSDKVGFNFDISSSWTESTYLHFLYNSQSADVWADGLKDKVEAKEYSLAIGWHGSINRTNDFFAELGYLKQDGADIIPNSTFGNDEEGYFAKLGLRGRLSAEWEYSVFAGYKDIDFAPYVNEALHEDDNDTIYGFETRYHFSPAWSVGVTVSEEMTGLTSNLNIRFTL